MKDLNEILSEKEHLEDLSRISKENKVPIVDYEVGRLLETLIFLKNPKNVLEIGCGEGYSSYFLAKNLKKASFDAIDLNKKRLLKAQEFINSTFPKLNTHFYSGNALKIIPDIESKFDFVFMDAAKFEYPCYLEVLMEKLKKKALIVADNIFCDEKIFSRFIKDHDKNSIEGIKKYIKFVQNNKLFETRIIDLGDGIAISIYK
ncbi:MAG: O-methyltransferase [Candidatus Humimicrobiaceae bacterium]